MGKENGNKKSITILLWIWFTALTFLSITNTIGIMNNSHKNQNLREDIQIIRQYLMQNSKIKTTTNF